MRNLKNKLLFLMGCLSLSLSFTIASCKSTLYKNTSINAKNIEVTADLGSIKEVEDFITPYRNHIDDDLNKVLSYSTVTMDKSEGRWETTIGNLFAIATLEEIKPIFKSRYNKEIDICMLNHGGIRSIISEGNVTTRTAFEVMPFENNAIVVELEGKQIQELAQFMIDSKKAHPLAGIQIFVDSNKIVNKIKINNQDLDFNKTYFVVTNDYLALGGDNMIFFTKAINKYDMDYKLRNVLLSYFAKHNPLPVITTQHIIEE